MKKLIASLFFVLLAVASQAQQYAVYATPAGVVKPLPNGATVLITAGAGGGNNQIQWNHAGLLDGFTAAGDASIDPGTGLVSISAGVVSNAKLATMAGSTFKGNNSISSGPPVDLTTSQAKALLAITPSDVTGLGSMATQSAGAVNITGGTISGAAVSGGSVSGSAISGGSITGLPAPSLASDAATKAYVDSFAAGIVQRTGVVVATTASITLSGEQTIDGVLTSGTRILVKNQAAPEANGIYVTAPGAWSRATDSNTAGQLLVGYLYFVSSGTVNKGSSWAIQSPAPTTLGSDPVTFAQFSASQVYSAGSGLSLVGTVFSNSGVTSLTGTANQVTVSSSVGGVTISTPSALTYTGKTVTGGTFNGAAFNGTVGATTPAGGIFTSLTSTSGAFNGTVGATTPSTGKFTTIGATGIVTIEGAGQGQIDLKKTGQNPFSIGSDAAGELYLYSNLTQVGKWTLTGINYTDIGTTVPGTGAFTTLSGSVTATGGSTSRTLAAHFKDIINVKDFGATGDGVTNDTTAIAAAVTALTANSTLYFPAGVYLTDVIGFASKTFVAIKGDGRTATIIRNRVAGNVIYFRPTCSDITMQDLTIDNNNSSRTAGQHGIVIGCSRFNLSNVGVTRCGEYAVLTGWDQIAGTTTAVSDIIVSNLYVYNTYADGMHFMTTTRGTLTNSIFVTDDDCIAVDGSFHVTVSNCVGTARNDLGTTWGRGIAVFNGSTDVIVSGCEMSNIKQAGIRVELAGGSAPARVTFADCLVYNCGLSSDGNIDVESGTDVSFIGGASRNAFNGNHMILQSGTRLTVNGMEFGSTTNAYARGITTGDTTSTEAIAGLFLVNNTFSFPLASQNEGIRIAKGISGAYYSNVAVTGNTGIMDSSEYLIFTRNMASTSKVYNNTSVGSPSTYFHDTSGGGSTPANGNNN